MLSAQEKRREKIERKIERVECSVELIVQKWGKHTIQRFVRAITKFPARTHNPFVSKEQKTNEGMRTIFFYSKQTTKLFNLV